LEAIAPVIAVRGNTDRADIWARAPEEVELELAGWKTVVVHGDKFGSPTPVILRNAYPDAEIIVFGHTHRPLLNRAGGRLVINPGAAGPRRFDLAPSVGIMTLSDDGAEAEIIEI
jgi:putative phosphoesterase